MLHFVQDKDVLEEWETNYLELLVNAQHNANQPATWGSYVFKPCCVICYSLPSDRMPGTSSKEKRCVWVKVSHTWVHCSKGRAGEKRCPVIRERWQVHMGFFTTVPSRAPAFKTVPYSRRVSPFLAHPLHKSFHRNTLIVGFNDSFVFLKPIRLISNINHYTWYSTVTTKQTNSNRNVILQGGISVTCSPQAIITHTKEAGKCDLPGV